MATPLRLERGWVPPQYPKSASDRADIRRAIRHNCLFSNLDEQAMTVMVDAMQRFHFEQGDEGDQFFVLASGAADVFIHGQRVGGVEADTTANFCGELALLYDSPRAATVKVTTPDVVAWGVDRVTFKKVFYEQGQPILEEGSQSNDFYIVSDGEVTCTKHGEEVRPSLERYVHELMGTKN
ncbi:hypothetical protein DYB31_011088 [Aphanomyces astaci]|uniref:Cyclic nucleotide-binding domain-containing protein n=1 Tax=Aphanomyces astaci TaxID=112090 RepID=A0A397F8L7_APHAT|nr:hypothetical protein DYB31_011088 [Aphanomyces astaci]